MSVTQRVVRKQPLPPPYASPRHCGQPTVLRYDGWECPECGVKLPFRNEYGLTWEEIRLHGQATPEKETTP